VVQRSGPRGVQRVAEASIRPGSGIVDLGSGSRGVQRVAEAARGQGTGTRMTAPVCDGGCGPRRTRGRHERACA
jgi:hypothetical protein